MREFVALGMALAGGVLAIITVVEVPPGGQITTGRLLLIIACLVGVGLVHFWPARGQRLQRLHSDARKVRR